MNGNSNPLHWITLSIGEIADVIAGGTPSANNPDNFAEPGTGIAWLTPADLSGYKAKYISRGARDLSPAGYSSCSAKLLPAGSLLFSSRAPIGYVAIASNDIATNQGFKNFVFPTEINSSYAYYFLRSIRNLAENLGTGTTFKEISGATAKTLPFMLPPLAEQKVIAEKLDALLAQVETTKARLERIPEIIKRFRQSVLAAAVSGRLTEEWRETFCHNIVDIDSVEVEMLSSGKTESNFGKKGERAKPIDSDEIELVVNHREGWPLIRIGSVCQSIVPNRDKPKSFSGGHHWLLTPHFDEDSIWIDYSKISEGLNDQEVRESRAKVIQPGNVIMTCVGRVGLSAVLEESAVINQQLHAFLVNPFIKAEYLAYCIRANIRYFETRATSTTVSYLNKTSCNSLPIPLPTVEEQTEIVRRVEQLFAFANAIEQKANAALERVNNLTQSILAKAFRGELTAEWRAANPDLISGENSAEALLERIKVERAGNVGRKRR